MYIFKKIALGKQLNNNLEIAGGFLVIYLVLWSIFALCAYNKISNCRKDESVVSSWVDQVSVFVIGGYALSSIIQVNRLLISSFGDNDSLGTQRAYSLSMCLTLISTFSTVADQFLFPKVFCSDAFG